jgi:signal-transduction protein with cAMP-binding, CBS, and nucleotidyltransferase domain
MAAEYSHSHGSKVAEVMTAEVLTVDEVTALEDIVELMEHKRIKRVPVVCGSQLVGLVTRSNLMHAMVSLARVTQPAAKDDGAIREMLQAEFQKEMWAPAAMTNVVVRDGVVELFGVIIDERQREAMKVAAENIPGVKAVNDHLVWVEPTSGMVIEPRDKAVAH